MVKQDDIEAFLDRLVASGATCEEVSEGLWDVRPPGALDFGVVVHYSPPVVVLRIKVMDVPRETARQAALNRRLLELNATDMLHGAYGIQNDTIVLTAALELEHLDFEEFLAAYESITVSLASHIRELATFREAR